LVIGALSHVVVLDKKDRDEYVQKRNMVATKMTLAQIVEVRHPNVHDVPILAF
jgi:hypothetical protein